MNKFNIKFLRYLSLFELHSNKKVINIDKSANYFIEQKAPRRIKELIPNVSLVFITIDPAKRAYSWYQHMRAHKDKIAINYTFYEVLTLNETDETVLKEMRKLRVHCLDPGIYIKHVSNWLQYFTTKQMHIVDGEMLRIKPDKCLHSLQNELLKKKDILNYTQLLKYSEKKGFFCAIQNDGYKNSTKCLGNSKGRKYPLIDNKSLLYLNDFFKEPNFKFYKFLKAKLYSIPLWLHKFI